MLVGVALATVSDVGLNFIGTLVAASAILATVISQILVKSSQQKLELDHMQLLLHVSPVIGVMLLFISPLFDDVIPSSSETQANISLVKYVSEGYLTVVVVAWAFLTCSLAFCVNVTNYMVVGKTSPTTYQVVGHLKTILVLFGGWLFLDKSADLVGSTLAVVGMLMYSYFKTKESTAIINSKIQR